MLAALAVRSMAAEVAKRRSEAERLFACRPARIQFGAGRRRMWRFAARCRRLRFVAFSWVGSDRSKRFRPNNVGSCHLPMDPDTNPPRCFPLFAPDRNLAAYRSRLFYSNLKKPDPTSVRRIKILKPNRDGSIGFANASNGKHRGQTCVLPERCNPTFYL